jgi:hypothetical protein
MAKSLSMVQSATKSPSPSPPQERDVSIALEVVLSASREFKFPFLGEGLVVGCFFEEVRSGPSSFLSSAMACLMIFR